MRLKFKYIVIAGLVLAAAETWRELAKPKESGDDKVSSSAGVVHVKARENQTPLTSIPPIPVTNWLIQVGDVLASNDKTSTRAINLLAMFPNLPGEGQIEVAQHVSRLLPDDLFPSFGSQLTNAAVSPAVRRVIFADLLNRPNAIKVPWLVEIARASVDGQSDEALFLLKSLLHEDYESNWSQWSAKASVWVKDHPDMSPAITGTSVSN